MRNEFRGLPSVVDRWLKERAIDRECKIIVGVSGGRDSMALAGCLKRIGQPLLVAHVNYGLRGTESDGDQAMVEKWCKEWGVPITVLASDALNTINGVQSAARNIRYQWFQTLKQKEKEKSFIATAHHADDQAETVLLHLIRSSDPLALAAMSPWSEPQGLLRPFLHVTRSEISAWVKEENIPFHDDSSNAKPDYLRNRLRNEVLPLLEELRSGTAAHIGRWADRWQPLSQHIENDLHTALSRCYRQDNENQGTLWIEAWERESLAEEILFHLAQSWKISARAVGEIKNLCGKSVQSGARFESSEAHVIRKNDSLIWNTTTVNQS
jgi:tRNA(Ile)-lysidine synthase